MFDIWQIWVDLIANTALATKFFFFSDLFKIFICARAVAWNVDEKKNVMHEKSRHTIRCVQPMINAKSIYFSSFQLHNKNENPPNQKKKNNKNI